jgi:hypothetical protein
MIKNNRHSEREARLRQRDLDGRDGPFKDGGEILIPAA